MSRVVLVSMPWDQLEYPPIQLGILQAMLQRAGIGAEVRSLKLDFLERCAAATGSETEPLGIAAYDIVVEWSRDIGIGDWLFAEPRPDLDEQYLELLRAHPVPEADIATALRFRPFVQAFLDHCADELVAAAPAVLGFTTGANQTVASLALARRVKARLPSVTVVFGGANCQGEMGAALHRAFSWVDVVVRGEGERVLPEIVKDVLAGNPIRPQPGLCYRDGDTPVAIDEAPGSMPMDEVPVPRYDEYFARLDGTSFGAALRPRVTILYESARGCWWGAKSHCTFCGISSLTMPFRSKRPERVVDELRTLARDASRVLVVDYILDWSYFREMLPRLRDAGVSLRLFCETKANLRKDQVRLLHDAGFRSIQAGVESLSDPILKSIRKGVTAFQNVRLMKWCAELGVHLYWNVLYGLPGEPPEEYARMADVMRSLVHLEPPRLVPLALDRFSPYHQRPEAYGLVPLGPRRDYRFIHPDLDAATLSALAYTFEYRHADGREPADYAAPVREVVEFWRAHRDAARGSLVYRRRARSLAVTDRRPGLPACEYRFSAAEAAIYLACEDGATLDEMEATLSDAGHRVSREDLDAFVDELTAARLVYRDGTRCLALALPAV